MLGSVRPRVFLIFCWLGIAMFTLSACGIFGSAGPEAEPTPTTEARILIPTFTPTVESASPPPTDTPIPPPVQAAAVEAPAEALEPAATDTPEVPPTDTPPPAPKLVVNIEIANARTGPGTNYGLAGAVSLNQEFDIVGKNPQGDWWQFCCVNGQQAWIFGQLVRAENVETVAVAENIPAPPPVVVAPPPTNTPVPAPAPEAPPAPPPPADPCAGIGGDGCKFKAREGPKFAPNGGNEIKLQLLFVHGGIDGGQPQGSYFVVMLKDGAKLPIGDNIRSIAKSSSQGSLGQYNYEYKVGRDQIPGNNVAGNYTMYVLDGNGERDSQDVNFSIPDGQGEVWLKWDQG